MALSSQSLFAAVTGRVIDGTGTPVADAMVMYTNVNNRLVYAYTCTDGRFSIIDPATFDVKNLQMYNCQTGVISDAKANRLAGSVLNLRSQGSQVIFYAPGVRKISVQLYTLGGKKIQTVFNDVLPQGYHQMSPLALLGQKAGHQAYVVQVSNGAQTQSKTLFYAGVSGGLGKISIANSSYQPSAMPKMMVAVDTIRAGKTNYFAAFKPVTAYSGDVGDIAITTRNVETQIDSIMANKSVQWEANQVTQGVQYNTANTWGTVFYGVGNGGPTCADNANLDSTWQVGTIASQGTPKMIGIDAVHGFISPPSGTMFPHNIAMGCTGSPLLAEIEERITAIELRSMGINWAFAPVVDVPRSIYWGRTYEGWDESPAGTVPLVVGAVRGFQGTDLSAPCVVAATAKHFAGGGGAVNGTNAGNCATASGANAQNILCSIHLPPFKAAVQNGLATTMAGMCSWQGVAMHFNKPLLTDTLKTAWQFDGFVVGDWDASNANLDSSFNSGLDNIMEPGDISGTGPASVNAAVQTAAAGRLADACRRILRVKLRLNLMQDPYPHRAYIPLVKSAMHTAVARECVRRSIVLLKDTLFNGAKPLPLSPTANICVVGGFANSMYMQCGGWCLNWPSAYYNPTPPPPPSGTTLLGAIQAVCTGTVTYDSLAANIPATANVVVVCVGELPYAEGGGDAYGNTPSQPITLTAAHQSLITKCVASGKPVVVVLYSGRPLVITSDIAKVPAWVAAWLPGPEGEGIADILFSVNGEKPTGKLSHTWPASSGQIPINGNNPATNALYGDFVGSGGAPLFAHGYGLTY
jgi:beta-glucosidase